MGTQRVVEMTEKNIAQVCVSDSVSQGVYMLNTIYLHNMKH